MDTKMIDSALIQAYHDTDYCVHAEPAFTLRVGQHSPEMAALYLLYQTTTTAFITACNPYSAELTANENSRLLKALQRDLEAGSWLYLPGMGMSNTVGWAGEASFLVLGISLEEAYALGKKHQQNGIIFSHADAIPRLVLCV